MANQNEGHRQRLREKFLKSGLDHASAALVFVHNHHLIIAGNYVYSFADHGLI